MSLKIDRSRWKKVRLGDVIRRSNAQVDPLEAGVERYVGGGHIDSDSLTIDRWGDVNDGQIGSTFRYVFKPGHVLFVSARPYLRKSGVVNFSGVVADKTYVLEARPEKGLLQEFLTLLLSSESFVQFATSKATGSMNPRLLWGSFQQHEFDLPPLDEQKQIASLLWAIEKNRRAVQVALTTAEHARSAVRNALFSSLSYSEARFESICLIASQNGAALTKSERAGDVPMVNMGEMFRGEVISLTSDYERVNSPGQKFLLAEGDLLFARRSIVFEGAGACCLVPELPEIYTFESSVIRSRVNSKIVDPRYILHFFRSKRGRELMSTIVRRGPVSGISGSDLRMLEIPLPDMEEQNRIVELITSSSLTKPVLERQNDAVATLLTTIMTDIFGDS